MRERMNDAIRIVGLHFRMDVVEIGEVVRDDQQVHRPLVHELQEADRLARRILDDKGKVNGFPRLYDLRRQRQFGMEPGNDERENSA